jgi:DnaJ-domain-containing protein 1
VFVQPTMTMRTRLCGNCGKNFAWRAFISVEFKDYYQDLGVDRNATAAEIKKAFRKLARKFHPDVANDKTRAESKFREINEANEVSHFYPPLSLATQSTKDAE